MNSNPFVLITTIDNKSMLINVYNILYIVNDNGKAVIILNSNPIKEILTNMNYDFFTSLPRIA